MRSLLHFSCLTCLLLAGVLLSSGSYECVSGRNGLMVSIASMFGVIVLAVGLLGVLTGWSDGLPGLCTLPVGVYCFMGSI